MQTMKKYIVLTVVVVFALSISSQLKADDDHHHGHHNRHRNNHHNRHHDNHHNNGHRGRVFIQPQHIHVQPQPVYIQPQHIHIQPQHVQPHSTQYIPSRPVNYVFGARSHTGALSIQLKNLANAMCLEAHGHYKHNPAFTDIYRDMYKVLTDAKHIADLANDTSSYNSVHGNDHIATDLNNIDQLFHRIQKGVQRWTADNAYHNTLPPKMAAVEEAIHHIMKDYGVKSNVVARRGGTQGSPQQVPQNLQRQNNQQPPQVPPSLEAGNNQPPVRNLNSAFPGLQ